MVPLELHPEVRRRSVERGRERGFSGGDPGSWHRVQQQAPLIDEMIAEFNREVGILR